MHFHRKLLVVTAATILFSLASYAGQGSANAFNVLPQVEILKSLPRSYQSAENIELTKGESRIFTSIMTGKPATIHFGGYILIRNKPAISEYEASDELGKYFAATGQYLVNREQIALTDSLIAAIVPSYISGSAMKTYKVFVGPPKNHVMYDVTILDLKTIGLKELKPGYLGRSITNEQDRQAIIRGVKALPAWVQEKLRSQHGRFMYKFSELKSRGGLQVGDTIGFKKAVME